MEEPSLLDYLKSKLSLKRLFQKTDVLDLEESTNSVAGEKVSESPDELAGVTKPKYVTQFPWRSLGALFLAFLAQRFLEPPALSATLGTIIYFASACMLVYGLLRKEWVIEPHHHGDGTLFPLTIRRVPLFFFIPLLLISFLTFGGNLFTSLNITIWVATLISGLMTFWIPEKHGWWQSAKEKISQFIRKPAISIHLDWWKILVVAAFLIAAFFHLYHLNSLPLEMTSDHKEKLSDVSMVLDGRYSIFFPNNAGREPIHFYLTALLVKVFNFGLNFFTLKFGMALAFLLSLVYVYKLGKEIGTRWTGLIAMLLIGFASWPNMITRVGLRLVLAPVFVAPVLFYLFRGIRRSNRNDFILGGIFLGLGLLGYSAFRIMPLVVVAGVVIYVVHQRLQKKSTNVGWVLLLLAVFAIVGFLPLLRFSFDSPELIGMRTLTRMTSAETQLPINLLTVFFQNFWNAITMPFWKDGTTWVISIPGRPALDIYSAALYFLGIVLLIFRWIKTRSWQDMFLLVSIPLLMLPSILSLAFPAENPSLSRAGGSIIPIFLICAIALESLLKSLWGDRKSVFSKVMIVILGIGIVGFSAIQNYDIALKQYPDQYARATWNSAEMGKVAKDFISVTGMPDNVWVVGVPHWVDTRLVAMSAGYIDKDYAIWPEDLETTLTVEGSKLFIVKYDDVIGIDRLKLLYPQGFPNYHSSPIEGRDFIAYIVPPG
jgi:hypothetical protein